MYDMNSADELCRLGRLGRTLVLSPGVLTFVEVACWLPLALLATSPSPNLEEKDIRRAAPDVD